MTSILPILGVLLAGGQSRRMGGEDKALKILHDKTLLDCIIDKVRPQVRDLVLNINSNTTNYQKFGLPIVTDSIEGSIGPLSGILAAMEWTKKYQPEIDWIASSAIDTPFVPDDLVHSLVKSIIDAQADIACARSGDQTHAIFGLWPVRLADSLRKDLKGGVRKIEDWVKKYDVSYANFETDPMDPFFDINTVDDLEVATTIFEK